MFTITCAATEWCTQNLRKHDGIEKVSTYKLIKDLDFHDSNSSFAMCACIISIFVKFYRLFYTNNYIL